MHHIRNPCTILTSLHTFVPTTWVSWTCKFPLANSALHLIFSRYVAAVRPGVPELRRPRKRIRQLQPGRASQDHDTWACARFLLANDRFFPALAPSRDSVNSPPS